MIIMDKVKSRLRKENSYDELIDDILMDSV